MQWIALALLLAPLLGHAGEIYRWRDADGVLHFTDIPPPKTAVEPHRLGAGNVVEAWRAQTRRRPQSLPQPEPNRAAVIEARRAREEQRAEKCYQARQRLDEVRARRRAGYKAAEGRRLQQRADRYQQDVRFYCGSWG